MKTIKHLTALWLAAAIIAFSLTTVRADEAKPKPYPLDTCLVCDMKLGSMGKPDVFVYKGQEIKVCDQSEQAEFEKHPDKYLKKLADLEPKSKK